ncbi:hypothetical protein ABFX02_06G082500 [Erythranthe guttata]
MSRHSQLPPRCPLQKKAVVPHANNIPLSEDSEFRSRGFGHNRSISQSSVLDEQPSWLNDLLSESESNSNITSHRRTASDSLMLLNGVQSLQSLNSKKETADSCGPTEEDELGSSCTYGPNSPRRKNKLGFPEKEIVSAFSERVMQNPLQNLDEYISVSGAFQPGSFGSACASVGEMNAENKSMKRHPGQRSRARKIEYIAELESTVDFLQSMGSRLAGNFASLIQQYAALSVENKTLKQHLVRMKQEKFIVDGEYQSLKKEVESLRTGLALSSNKKVHNRSVSAANFAHSDPVWSMLDMRKLDLN